MIPVVSIACIDENVWIRVKGRGNFQCSPCFKKLVEEYLLRDYHDYIIDLAECEHLDSTFMGTLTGIAQRLKNTKEGRLRVINVSDSNRQLMENLGLDQLFPIFPIFPIADGKGVPPAADHSFSPVTEVANICKQSATETVRSAHEALIIANQANAKKFQSLLEIM